MLNYKLVPESVPEKKSSVGFTYRRMVNDFDATDYESVRIDCEERSSSAIVQGIKFAIANSEQAGRCDVCIRNGSVYLVRKY